MSEADEISPEDLAAAGEMFDRLEAGTFYQDDGDDDEEVLAAQMRAEYAALTDYQRGAYDYCGQRGGDHDACMDAAHSI